MEDCVCCMYVDRFILSISDTNTYFYTQHKMKCHLSWWFLAISTMNKTIQLLFFSRQSGSILIAFVIPDRLSSRSFNRIYIIIRRYYCKKFFRDILIWCSDSVVNIASLQRTFNQSCCQVNPSIECIIWTIVHVYRISRSLAARPFVSIQR